MLKFCKKHPSLIISIFGLAFTIVGLALGYYYFSTSLPIREPIFLVDETRTIIADVTDISSPKFKVVRTKDGSDIVNNIIAVNFVFWNAGNTSIRNENILSPITVLFKDDKIELLDWRITAATRPDIIKANLVPDISAIKPGIMLEFDILEGNDAITGQILYAGNRNAPLTIKGAIEGVKDIKVKSDIISDYLISAAFSGIFIMLVLFGGIFLLFILAGSFLFVLDKILVFIMPKKIKQIEKALKGIVVIFVLVSAILPIIFMLWDSAEKQVGEDLPEMKGILKLEK